ncbi:MAG: type II secretion system protein [Patescibacteria group bacterium]
MKKGFTLIETLVVLGMFFAAVALAVPVFRSFQKESDLSNATHQIQNILKLAQSKTIASESESKYGVSFNTALTPHRYTLFQGNSYASRDPAFDQVFILPTSVEIFLISLGAGSEAVFDRIQGTTSQSGTISLRVIGDPSKTATIYVENSGKIATVNTAVASDSNRIKDSRHTHIDYTGRIIDTATEKIIIHDSFTPVEIRIADYLEGGQIQWTGEVNAGGQIQKLKIHTHILNDVTLRTQFSIHRDRRYNNRHIHVSLSGDSTGDLIQYADNGDTTQGTSLYALPPSLQ